MPFSRYRCRKLLRQTSYFIRFSCISRSGIEGLIVERKYFTLFFVRTLSNLKVCCDCLDGAHNLQPGLFVLRDKRIVLKWVHCNQNSNSNVIINTLLAILAKAGTVLSFGGTKLCSIFSFPAVFNTVISCSRKKVALMVHFVTTAGFVGRISQS